MQGAAAQTNQDEQDIGQKSRRRQACDRILGRAETEVV